MGWQYLAVIGFVAVVLFFIGLDWEINSFTKRNKRRRRSRSRGGRAFKRYRR